ncbi:hypothetical protein PROFUN_15529 [Planoprotostelium fungivorum]|uniref:Uncharacterized protein n=1 Tax=Planoprotostelium fungivorum TaxID=1890364 RepID=A0A2P6MUS5_9EUKA|nr:hypothetical protein PROFUN_15529 [Planoprotostelium fungivorum]
MSYKESVHLQGLVVSEPLVIQSSDAFDLCEESRPEIPELYFPVPDQSVNMFPLKKHSDESQKMKRKAELHCLLDRSSKTINQARVQTWAVLDVDLILLSFDVTDSFVHHLSTLSIRGSCGGPLPKEHKTVAGNSTRQYPVEEIDHIAAPPTRRGSLSTAPY